MLESTNKKSQVAAQMEAAMATNSTNVCDVGGNDTLKTVDLPPRVQITGRLLFTESRRLWVDDEDSTPMSIDRVDRHHRPPHAISIVSGGEEKHEDDKNQEEDVAMLGGGADDCIPNVEEQQPFDEVKGNDSTSMEDVDVLEEKEHNDDVAEIADKHEEDVVQENREEESDDPKQPPMIDESSEEVEEEGIEVDNSLLDNDIPTTTTTTATPKQKEPRGFALLKLKARKKTISSSTDQGEKKSKNKVIGMRHRLRFGARGQSKKVFASVEQPPLAELDVDLYPADTPSSSVLASIIIATSPDVEDQIMYKEDIKDENNPADTPTTTTTNQSSVMLELFPSPSHISTATPNSKVVSSGFTPQVTESPNNNGKAAVTSVGDQLPPSMPSIFVAKKEEDHDMEDDENVEIASVLDSEETKDEYHQDQVHEDEDHKDGGDHKDKEAAQDQKNGEKSDESALSVVTESLSLSAEDIAGGRIVCIEDEQGVIDTSTDVVDVSSTLQGDINDVEVIKCLGFDDIDYQLKEVSEANINENVKEEVSADVFDNLSSSQDYQIKTDAMEVSSSTLKETKKTRKQHRLSKILKPKSQFGPIAGLSSEAKEALKASLRPIIIAPIRKKPAPTTANKVGLSAEAQAIIASDTDLSRKAQYVLPEDAKADDDVQEVEVEKSSQRQNTITTSKKQKQVPVMIIQQKRTIDSSYADSYESQYDVSTFGDTLTYNSDDSFVSKMSDNGRCNFGRPCGIGIPQDELVGDLIEAYNDTRYHMQQIIGIWGGGLTERQRSSSGRGSSRRTTAASDSSERSQRETVWEQQPAPKRRMEV